MKVTKQQIRKALSEQALPMPQSARFDVNAMEQVIDHLHKAMAILDRIGYNDEADHIQDIIASLDHF